MFSAYSWWDFIKVALCLLVPYYLFVAFKYYREDIREWFSNRGQNGGQKLAAATESPVDPGQLTKGLFTTQTYESLPAVSEPAPAAEPQKAADPPTAQSAQTTPPPAQTTPPPPQTTPAVADRPVVTNEVAPTASDHDQDEEELDGLLGDGPALTEQGPVVIPFAGTLVVPTESSLKELIAAGQHLQRQDDGRITAPEGDEAGNQLAGYINQQRNKPAGLEGISFNRS